MIRASGTFFGTPNLDNSPVRFKAQKHRNSLINGLANTRHVANAVVVTVVDDAAVQVDDKLKADNSTGRR